MLRTSRTIRHLLLLAMSGTMLSCASGAISITYSSEPQGAMISSVDSIVPVGRTPITKSYSLASLPPPDENGCVVIPGVEALWDSGATARVARLRICDLEDSRRFIELPRPRGYPGLDIDLEIAAKQGRQRARDRDFEFIGGVEPPRSNPAGN